MLNLKRELIFIILEEKVKEMTEQELDTTISRIKKDEHEIIQAIYNSEITELKAVLKEVHNTLEDLLTKNSLLSNSEENIYFYLKIVAEKMESHIDYLKAAEEAENKMIDSFNNFLEEENRINEIDELAKRNLNIL